MTQPDLSVDDQMQELVAAALFAGMKMMVDRGISPSKALRAVAVEYLQETYGSQVWKELEVPSRTIERWRAELREALELAPRIEDEPPASVIAAFERLQAKRPAKK